ncbi:tRNA (adenine(58)-N(1))-methyltransferase, mitochondrial isoform X2 [Hemibagrus wyckioides]|uniref:tRNA (adenine(58)-N(1))-methyltransferase, mitochondrial isoform X2 n=1 Tax=Hemibagrus wyckioides TaxID=337641 RepID=UPI00266D2AB5|nr:tRNA (adenine(58)-N(1))-methyltransferase, mitochondrial isoform X2 [Hemibagrus wyckioides]
MSAFGLCFSLGPSLLKMTPRLARVCATCLSHKINLRITSLARIQWVGTGPKSPDGDEDGSGAPVPSGPTIPPFSRSASRFGRRPLSPLERVSQMLPQESLSEEVWELREEKTREDYKDTETQTPETLKEDPDMHEDDESVLNQGKEVAHVLPEERVMCFGEVVLAEYRRKRRLELQKMFQLEKGCKLGSSWGSVAHDAIQGCHAGTVLRTSLGLPMLIRRPSLEEFTLFMKRGPAIAYPKDANAMLMMMDVNEGDCVLESGSGSGAMSLFLSRAVGSSGSVLSVEVREDHHRRAVLNYERWRSSWSLRSGKEWPENVHFHLGDLINAAPLLAGRSFNSVALDMINPHLALHTVVPHLHTGGVCAVYQANITQIIDLMEGLRCSTLPLVYERIIEVQYRDWLLAPSLKKDGSFHQRRKSPDEEATESENDEANDEGKGHERAAHFPFGSVPYIARPHPEQNGHTGEHVRSL